MIFVTSDAVLWLRPTTAPVGSENIAPRLPPTLSKNPWPASRSAAAAASAARACSALRICSAIIRKPIIPTVPPPTTGRQP